MKNLTAEVAEDTENINEIQNNVSFLEKTKRF